MCAHFRVKFKIFKNPAPSESLRSYRIQPLGTTNIVEHFIFQNHSTLLCSLQTNPSYCISWRLVESRKFRKFISRPSNKFKIDFWKEREKKLIANASEKQAYVKYCSWFLPILPGIKKIAGCHLMHGNYHAAYRTSII